MQLMSLDTAEVPSVGHDPGIKKVVAVEKEYDYDTMSEIKKKEVEKEAQGRYLAVAFVLGADRQRYGRLIENLENDYLQGQNNYPSTITAAYNLLTNWKQDPRNLVRTIGPVNDGVSFMNIDDGDAGQEVALANRGQQKSGTGADGKDRSYITCHRCGKQGHYANQCEEQRKTGAAMLMSGIKDGEFNG